MRKKMAVLLAIGIIGLLCGILMISIPAIPKIVAALVGAISGGWIGVAIASKFGTSIRDEMVVRVEHMSGYYAFNATMYFLFVLAGMNMFTHWTFSISDLLLAMMIFMSFSYILFKYFLLRRGKAE
jgi:hypothetical protein